MPPTEVILQARIVDELRILQWALAGAKKEDFPESIAGQMIPASGQNSGTKEGYNSGADFDRAWKELTGNG